MVAPTRSKNEDPLPCPATSGSRDAIRDCAGRGVSPGTGEGKAYLFNASYACITHGAGSGMGERGLPSVISQ